MSTTRKVTILYGIDDFTHLPCCTIRDQNSGFTVAELASTFREAEEKARATFAKSFAELPASKTTEIEIPDEPKRE